MESNLRRWMRLVEANLTEIERGGELNDDDEWEKVDKADFDSRQTDMFGNETDFQPEGSFDGYDISIKNPDTMSSDGHTYVLFRGGVAVAYATLETYGEGDDDYRVKVIRVAPSEQGKNLAPRFYRWLLTDGHVGALYADENQTDGGAKIWERLVTTPGIAVFITANIGSQGRRVKTINGLARVWETDRYHLYATAA